MSGLRDQRGIEYTAAGEEAVRAFDATMDAYVHFRTDTGDRLKETFAADPEFPMAHCLRGYFMQLFCIAALTEKASRAPAPPATSAASASASATTSRPWTRGWRGICTAPSATGSPSSSTIPWTCWR